MAAQEPEITEILHYYQATTNHSGLRHLDDELLQLKTIHVIIKSCLGPELNMLTLLHRCLASFVTDKLLIKS